MEFFVLILVLLVIVTIIMPWVNHARIGAADHNIAQLEAKLKALEAKFTTSKEEAVSLEVKHAAAEQKIDVKYDEVDKQPDPVPAISVEDMIAPASAVVTPTTSSIPRVPKTDWVKKAQSSFEQNVATKLPVWIGALSLICAAFFLVKYSIELGWLGPVPRILMGGLFGVGLLAAGQWMANREHLANAVRISQGLIGAGLVALYVSIYAAINLYGLLPPLLGFTSMTAVTALAVILSLRHGQPIAMFGLLGGLLTPALVGSDEPNAMAMFAYLFLLFSGMLTVLVRKQWWALAVVALVGVLGWSICWFAFVFAAADAFVLLLFAMGVVGSVLTATAKHIAHEGLSEVDKLSIHGLNFTALAGGALTILWLSFEVTLGLFDWSMLGLLSLAMMALAYFKPSIYEKPLLAKFGLSLILYATWAQDALLTDSLMVLTGMSAIYVGGGAFMMRRVSDPRFWAAMQSLAALALFGTAYFIIDVSHDFMWGAVSLILAGLAIYQTYDILAKYTVDDKIRSHLIAIYTLTASAFISIGLTIELPWGYVPLAIAGQIATTAWIYRRTNIEFLEKVLMILALAFIAMNYDQVFLFLDIALSSLVDDALSTQVSSYILALPLLKLGLSGVFVGYALWVTPRNGSRTDTLVHILFGTLAALIVGTFYYMSRDFFGDIKQQAGFVERGYMTVVCAVAGIGLLHLVSRYDVIAYMKPWALGLFYLALARFTYFDLLILNPYWNSSQFVGDMPIFNGVMLTYGGGTLMAACAMCSNISKGHKTFYGALGLVALFALISLSVRQYFNGGFLDEGAIQPAEMYAYSVAWLLTGLGILAAGIKYDNKPARMVSLVFIVLAVAKVFLFDAAELEGLYRVFSFLGLGVSLIGLSYFYTKFAFSPEQTEKDA